MFVSFERTIVYNFKVDLAQINDFFWYYFTSVLFD